LAILAFLLKGVAAVLGVVINLIIFVVIGRAIISWVNADPSNPIVRFLYDSSEPLLRPIRRYVPPVGPGIDLSPMILLLILLFLQEFLVGLISHYAVQMALNATVTYAPMP